jgi:prepilin-type N-terminal cleavage/methylation domain-containing protein
MNNKGFTLIELLATIIILGIIVGITVTITNTNMGNAKEKAEEVFIDTLDDALKIYTDSDAKKLRFGTSPVCTLEKSHGNVKVYKSSTNVTFNDVINSEYKPLDVSDIKNPNNEDVQCNINAAVNIYRDDDYIYYYKVEKASFNCLKTTGKITNLPSECNG